MLKRIIWLGILGVIVLYALPKLLFQLSLIFDRSTNDTVEEETDLLFPPTIDTLPEATNSAILEIKGFAPNAEKVELLINDIPKEKIVVATKDGNFIIPDVRLYDGENKITAIAYGKQNEKSNPSDPMMVTYKSGNPKLVVESPEDGATFSADQKRQDVRGLTDPENTVSVNGRWARVSPDGSFRYPIELAEGENTVEVVTVDRAGNETRITRLVTYTK